LLDGDNAEKNQRDENGNPDQHGRKILVRQWWMATSGG
jgi:hypothetical protein